MSPPHAARPAGQGDHRDGIPQQLTPVVRRLCCLRGVSTLTGFALAVEIGDWERFTGSTIGAFVERPGAHRVLLGRPSVSRMSSPRPATGTPARLLIEAAWHHRKDSPPGVPSQAPLGPGAAGRPCPRPPWATSICTTAGSRRHRQEETAGHRQRRPSPGSWLAGWCWSLAVMPDLTRHPQLSR